MTTMFPHRWAYLIASVLFACGWFAPSGVWASCGDHVVWNNDPSREHKNDSPKSPSSPSSEKPTKTPVVPKPFDVPQAPGRCHGTGCAPVTPTPMSTTTVRSLEIEQWFWSLRDGWRLTVACGVVWFDVLSIPPSVDPRRIFHPPRVLV